MINEVNKENFWKTYKFDRKDYLSPGWSEFALSLFEEDELIEGRPLVAGLRRVAEMLLGEVKSSRVVEVFPVKEEGPGRATVVYEVEFVGDVRYSDVADVYEQNVDPNFLPFAVATAATRAEARCLRKALKLKVCSHDEMPGEAIIVESKVVGDPMSEPQANLISKKCRTMNADVLELLKLEGLNARMSKSEASSFIDKLNTYANEDCLPKVGPYKEYWRN